jgi:hypothetical protein
LAENIASYLVGGQVGQYLEDNFDNISVAYPGRIVKEVPLLLEKTNYTDYYLMPNTIKY